MENYLSFLSSSVIKLQTIYSDNMIDSSEKEKMIKKCIKDAVDENPSFGEQTKQDLKSLIEIASSEREMFGLFVAYVASYNCSN